MSTLSSQSQSIFLTILIAGIIVSPVATFGANGDISLAGHLPLGSGGIYDVWGWYDSGTGKEYAIVGDDGNGAVYIVDVSTPTSPVLVSTVLNVPGFDVKVWDHYVYTCNGGGFGYGSRVIDIANPATPLLSPSTFRDAHNITIDKYGYMYLSYTGMAVYDLNSTPMSPDSIYYDFVYWGHDATARDSTLFDFNGTNIRVLNTATPGAPTLVGTITDGTIDYIHSGDMDKTGRYLYVCDELALGTQADIIVFDLSSFPLSYARVNEITDSSGTVHNLYIVDDFAFVSYYASGFKTIDVSDPANPVVTDTYDTTPVAGDTYYYGAFGVYPYAPSRYIYVSDYDGGLFIFHVDGFTNDEIPSSTGETSRVNASLEQNYPNPFNPVTSIGYTVDRPGNVTLRVFDVGGRLVRTLVDKHTVAGSHEISWNGRNDLDHPVASGVYYYELRAGSNVITNRMVLLK